MASLRSKEQIFSSLDLGPQFKSDLSLPSSEERGELTPEILKSEQKGNNQLHLLANNSTADINQRQKLFRAIYQADNSLLDNFNDKGFQPFGVFSQTWWFVLPVSLPTLEELNTEIASLPYDRIHENYSSFVADVRKVILEHRSNAIEMISIHLFDYFEDAYHFKRRKVESERVAVTEIAQNDPQSRLTMSIVDRKRIESLLVKTVFYLFYVEIEKPCIAWKYLFSFLPRKYDLVEKIVLSIARFVEKREVVDNLVTMKYLQPQVLVQRSSTSYVNKMKSLLSTEIIQRANNFFRSDPENIDLLIEDYEKEFSGQLEAGSILMNHLRTLSKQEEEEEIITKVCNRWQVVRSQLKSVFLSFSNILGQVTSTTLEPFIYQKRNEILLQMTSLKVEFTFVSFFTNIQKEIIEMIPNAVFNEQLISFVFYILFQEMYCFQLLSYHLLGINYWCLPHAKRLNDHCGRAKERIIPQNDYEYCIELIEFFIVSTINQEDSLEVTPKQLILKYWPEFLTSTTDLLTKAITVEASKGVHSANFQEEQEPKPRGNSLKESLEKYIHQRLSSSLENLGKDLYQVVHKRTFSRILDNIFQKEKEYYQTADDISPDQGGAIYVGPLDLKSLSLSTGSGDITKVKASHELKKTQIRELMFHNVLHNNFESSFSGKLHVENFQRFHVFVKKCIQNELDYLFVLYSLTIDDLGRTEETRKIVHLEDENRFDHDTVVREFVNYCLGKQGPSLLPFYARFSQQYQADLLEQLRCPFNIGQFVQGENLPKSVSDLLIMIPNEKLRGIRLLVGLISFCAMRLEKAPNFNEDFENYMKAIDLLLSTNVEPTNGGNLFPTKATANPTPRSMEEEGLNIYQQYLDYRCHRFNYGENHFAIQRLLLLSRATREDEEKKLNDIFEVLNSLSETERNFLLSELSRTGLEASGKPAILIYYFPAIIGNAVSAEGSFEKGLTRALKVIIEVYQTARNNIEKEGSIESVFTSYAKDKANAMNKK